LPRASLHHRLARVAEFAAQALMAAYVYVLIAQNPGGRTITYVGWTLDLARRLAEHNGAGKHGAKSTRARNWTLVYAEKHRTRKGAMKREYVLKKDRAFRVRLRSW
jgi:putative endonuclease